MPRNELPSAVAANSVGVNISRAIGPALAGVLTAAAHIAVPFWVNAVSNLGTIAALKWWRPPPQPARRLPAERFMSALRTGIRYTRHNRLLRATLARAVAFFVFASAYWALLPLVAREQIAGGPELYGILLGAIGAGAIGGAFFWPRVRSKLGTDHLVAVGTIGTALALALYGFARDAVTGATASIIAGVCWIAVLSSLNVSAQFALPEWVRRRGLAVYVTVMFGAMTIGSAFWGQIARMAGLPIAHLLAAAGAVVAIPLTRRWKLHSGATIDLAPSMHWPAPVVAGEIENDQGPVLVTIEYHVAERNRGALLAALDKVEHERRRDGAYAWQVFEDTAETGRFLETFLVESWVEHLRQHERVTNADRVLQEHVHRLLELPPKVTHLISAEAASQRHDRVPSASPSQL